MRALATETSLIFVGLIRVRQALGPDSRGAALRRRLRRSSVPKTPTSLRSDVRSRPSRDATALPFIVRSRQRPLRVLEKFSGTVREKDAVAVRVVPPEQLSIKVRARRLVQCLACAAGSGEVPQRPIGLDAGDGDLDLQSLSDRTDPQRGKRRQDGCEQRDRARDECCNECRFHDQYWHGVDSGGPGSDPARGRPGRLRAVKATRQPETTPTNG